MIYIGVWAMGVEVSVAVYYPTGHTTLLKRWINVTGVDSTSQQRRVSMGMSQRLFSGVQIQLKVSLAQSEIQLTLIIFYYAFVKKIH